MRHLAEAIVDRLLDAIEDRGIIVWLDDEAFAENRDDLVTCVENMLDVDQAGR